MIITLTPRDAARCPATILPEECQEPALRYLMTPRVASWSMYPTLCKGDCLELGPADPLQVGDLVVFRKPAGLVCHRLIARRGDVLLTRGDAHSGDPEALLVQDVLGVVTAVMRGTTRIAPADLAMAAPILPWGRVFDHLYITLLERGHRLTYAFIRLFLKTPWLGEFVAYQLVRHVTIEPVGDNPIRSFTDTAALYPATPGPDHATPSSLPSLHRIRLGPITLGRFSPRAERLELRPILTGTGVEPALAQALRRT